MYLHLDTSIRNWVFFPIIITMIFLNLLMKYLNKYLNQTASANAIKSNTKEQDFVSELRKKDDEIKVSHNISRSVIIRNNFMYISEKGFKLRKTYYCKPEEGYFNKIFENKPMDIGNPNMMVDMMKKNFVSMINYAVIYVGVGTFFSGFILLKLPFSLTLKFRSMLQQGLNIPSLDLSYVSALSWCFLLVFSLGSILNFIDDSKDDFSMLKDQEKMMTQPFGGSQEKDFNKMMSVEKENLEIVPFFSVLDDAVSKVIEKYEI